MKREAFSLVEVVIAVGLSVFALVGVFSLLPAGLRAVSDGMHAYTASQIAAGLVADLERTATGSISTNYFFGMGATPATDAAAAFYQFEISLDLVPAPKNTLTGRLSAWWPAAAGPTNAQGRLDLPLVICR